MRRGDGSSRRHRRRPPRPRNRPLTDRRARDSVLVGDIENKTGDPLFDGTIRQALALVLAQSSHLEVLSDRRVHAALAVMQRQGAPVLGDVALEVCQRTNTKAAITGSIFVLGDDYVIGLYAMRGDTGDTLLSEQARARGKGEVLRALDQAALGLRAKLGESLASITRYSSGLAEVATASLEALKAYSTGRETWLSSGEAAAAPFLLRAIELDPNFLAAYTGLALIYGNLGQYTRAAEYMQKAYDLRERASSDSERYRIIGVYHDIVTGDIHKALDAYRAMPALQSARLQRPEQLRERLHDPRAVREGRARPARRRRGRALRRDDRQPDRSPSRRWAGWTRRRRSSTRCSRSSTTRTSTTPTPITWRSCAAMRRR